MDGVRRREDFVKNILFGMVASGYGDPHRTATTILMRWIRDPAGVRESDVVEAVAAYIRYLGAIDG